MLKSLRTFLVGVPRSSAVHPFQDGGSLGGHRKSLLKSNSHLNGLFGVMLDGKREHICAHIWDFTALLSLIRAAKLICIGSLRSRGTFSFSLMFFHKITRQITRWLLKIRMGCLKLVAQSEEAPTLAYTYISKFDVRSLPNQASLLSLWYREIDSRINPVWAGWNTDLLEKIEFSIQSQVNVLAKCAFKLLTYYAWK